MLGMIYAQIGDQGKAQNEYERALSLAPTDGNVLNAYGAYACEQGKYAVAEAQFAKALADPFNRQPAQALANAGKCARKAGDLAKAETYLRQAVDKDPDSAEALFTLAEVQLALGRPMEARAFIQRREALGAADARVLELAARVEDAAGDSRRRRPLPRTPARSQSFPRHAQPGRDQPAMSLDSFQDSLFDDPIGKRFMLAREKQRWSKESVAQQLKLPISIIEAIEAENWSRLGAPIYIRSYVGSYAKMLGLPADLADDVIRSQPTPTLVQMNNGSVNSHRSFDRGVLKLGSVVMTGVIVGGVVMLAMHLQSRTPVAADIVPLDPPVTTSVPVPAPAVTAGPGQWRKCRQPGHRDGYRAVPAGTVTGDGVADPAAARHGEFRRPRAQFPRRELA